MCSTPTYQPSNDGLLLPGFAHVLLWCKWYILTGATLLHEFMHLDFVMNTQTLDGMSWPGYKHTPLDQVLTVIASRSRWQRWRKGESYSEFQNLRVSAMGYAPLRTDLWVCCTQASGNPELGSSPQESRELQILCWGGVRAQMGCGLLLTPPARWRRILFYFSLAVAKFTNTLLGWGTPTNGVGLTRGAISERWALEDVEFMMGDSFLPDFDVMQREHFQKKFF